MNAKTIADLIHDRAFAEGATLCVWLDGCRFRRINVAAGQEQIRPRMIRIGQSLGVVDADGVIYVPGYSSNVASYKFEPSPELAALMRRNIEELRSYLRGVVSEWCKEFGVDAAGGVKA